MGKIRTALFAFGTFLALSAVAQAQEKQVTTSKGNTDTARVFVSGNQTTDYVQRDKAITAFTDSISNPTGGGNPTGSRSENTFEGETGIRFTAELTNKVTAVVEVGTRRIDGSPDPVTGDGGMNRFGEGEALTIKLKEANLVVPIPALAGLQAQLGITTWKFNPRGKGGSLAFDPRNSQTVTRNLDSDDAPFNRRDDGVNRFAEAAFAEFAQPVGAVITYQDGPLLLDLVLLPTMNDEGGAPADDDQLYALDGLLNLDALGLPEGSRVGLIVALTCVRTDAADFITPGGDEGRTRMLTLGGGTSVKVLESLEASFEGYAQAGKAGELLNGQRVAAGGHAVRLGVEWHHVVANPMPIWAGISFTHISGEKDGAAEATNRKASRFSAYESVNDLMIIEDPYFGFDWDSNYQATKISGGISTTVVNENDLDLMAIIGITRAVNRVNVPTGGTENKLGNEVDIRATWHITKQFGLKLSLAYLWGSTLLEKSMGGAGNPNASDSAFLFVLGWDLTF
jgi:hypothetical protein